MKTSIRMPFFILRIALVSTVAACGLPTRDVGPVPAETTSPVEPQVSSPSHSGIDRPAGVLVDDFDRVIQARFEDLRDGKFGISRMARLGPQHRRIFEPKDEIERLTLEKLRGAGWTTTMYVVEPRPEGAKAGAVRGAVDTGQPMNLRWHANMAIKSLAARAMTAKSPALGVIGGLPMEARPVLASSVACLGCHADRKLGDPLGAVVYGFLPAPFERFAKP